MTKLRRHDTMSKTARASVWRDFAESVADSYVMDEGPLDDPQAPFTISFEGAPADRIVFITKDAMLRYWQREDLLPASALAFVLHGPAAPRHCAIVKREAELRGLPVLFHGDLDPMDLTTFGTLRAGGTNWPHDPTTAVEIVYNGIDDHLLAIAESECVYPVPAGRSRGPAEVANISLGALFVRMSNEERRHLELLQRLMPDLEALVGQRCMSLLNRGWKLEVEALYPRLYKPGFAQEVMSHVFSAGRS